MTMPSFDAVKNGKTHTVGSYEIHLNWEHDRGRCEYQKISDMDSGGAHAFEFDFAQMKPVWDTFPSTITKGMTAVQLKAALQKLQQELIFLEDGITKP